MGYEHEKNPWSKFKALHEERERETLGTRILLLILSGLLGAVVGLFGMYFFLLQQFRYTSRHFDTGTFNTLLAAGAIFGCVAGIILVIHTLRSLK